MILMYKQKTVNFLKLQIIGSKVVVVEEHIAGSSYASKTQSTYFIAVSAAAVLLLPPLFTHMLAWPHRAFDPRPSIHSIRSWNAMPGLM